SRRARKEGKAGPVYSKPAVRRVVAWRTRSDPPPASDGARRSRQRGERSRARTIAGWVVVDTAREPSPVHIEAIRSDRTLPMPTPGKAGRVTVRCSRRVGRPRPRNGSQALNATGRPSHVARKQTAERARAWLR